METKLIPIREIEKEAWTQVRVVISKSTVDEYAEAMRDGAEFPPIDVVFDGFAQYWIVDGWHRFQAHCDNGEKEIRANVIKEGTQRDAIWEALTCYRNHQNGVRLTNGDKRRIVEYFLRDPEWSKWSSRQIAEHSHVSKTFVENIRREHEVANGCGPELATVASSGRPGRRVGKDGKARPMPPLRKNQGPKPKPETPAAKPKPKKSGAQKVDPTKVAKLKEHFKAAGKLLDDLGWMADVEAPLNQIWDVLKDRW